MSQIAYDHQSGSELHIVDISDARTMDKSSFDGVVTVCQDSIADNVSEDTAYNFFCMSDGPNNSYGGDSSYRTFSRASNTVFKALHDGENVLLHCHMGQSRSVSVAVAALGRLLDMPRYEAFELVENYRPQAHPDQLLMGYAATYIEQHSDNLRRLWSEYEKDE